MMFKTVILILLLTTLCSVMSNFVVHVGFGEGREVANNTLVVLKKGKDMKLWCDGSQGGGQDSGIPLWDSCHWFRPNFGSSSPGESNFCKYDTTFNMNYCPEVPSQFSPWTIDKIQTRCVLYVTSVNENDLGSWKCSLIPKNVPSNSSSFSEVSIRRDNQEDPTVNFNPGPPKELTVGDKVHFICNGTLKSKNKPDIGWTIGSLEFSGNKHVNNVSSEHDNIRTWQLDSALDYSANIHDDQGTVVCRIFVRDDFGNLVETSVQWTGLNISPRPQNKSGTEAWIIIISIIIPLIIIIIIIVILIWCFGCFCFGARKEKEDHETVVNSHHAKVPYSKTTYANTLAPVRNRNSHAYDTTSEDESRYGKLTLRSNSGRGQQDGGHCNLHPDEGHHNLHQIPRSNDIPKPAVRNRNKTGGRASKDPFADKLPWDPVNELNDQLINYCYEGSDSETGSLSSISSVDSSDDNSLGRQFQVLGSPFQNLAELYKPDSDDSDSSEEEYSHRSSCTKQTFENESWV